MTSEIRHKPPETIKDLYTQNYTIVIVEAQWSWKLINGMIPEQRRPLIMNLSADDYYGIFENEIQNASAKLAVFISENREYKGVQLKETLFSDNVGLVMPPNQYLYWLIEETLQKIIPTGIPQHIKNFHLEVCYPPKDVEEVGPQVLTIDDLNYGFVIWIVAIFITLIAFFFEFLMDRIVIKILNGVKKYLRKVFGLILVVTWLTKNPKDS